jgi:hypothetical protein
VLAIEGAREAGPTRCLRCHSSVGHMENTAVGRLFDHSLLRGTYAR